MNLRWPSIRSRRRGSVLVITMSVLFVLVGLVLVLARSMRVEGMAAANYAAELQAEAVAQGAAQYILARIQENPGRLPADEEISAEAVPVGSGYFWVLKHQAEDDRNRYYGLTDEAGKLNVNTATVDMLSRLPGMTSDMAAAIVDWRDSDSNTTPGGVESQYYQLLEDPYLAKDSTLETCDELLLIRDMTPQVVFGEDPNRNTVLDANEDDADQTEPPDNRDGRLDRGVIDFVTVYTREPNTSADGQRRVNINSRDVNRIASTLRNAVPEPRLTELIGRIRAGQPYLSVLDFYVQSGMELSEFQQVADRLTTSDSGSLRGMINVNTAPREVLLALPGLEEADAQSILARRPASSTAATDITWLVEALPREKLGAAGAFVTGRSYQCSADIVAVDAHGRAFKRYLAVFDARPSPARIVYWREMTGLGWPLAPEILEELRAGGRLEATTRVTRSSSSGGNTGQGAR